jgi:hypothetical protein
MPEDVALYGPVWECVITAIEAGKIAVTAEIYEELCHITGDVGDCIRDNKESLLMELDDPSWGPLQYIANFDQMRKNQAEWIAEYSMKSPARTITSPDLTGIALAKTLALPLIHMESSAATSPKHKRIPDICALEGVLSYSFNDFLRLEGGL